MRTIIAGSRNITNYDAVLNEVCESGFQISEIISGGAKGVDSIAEQIALDHNIPIKVFPANWAKYGKWAGHARNKEMAEYAEALIAVWDGFSPGTKNMINTAKSLGLQVHVGIV